jgi:hypothetical protein
LKIKNRVIKLLNNLEEEGKISEQLKKNLTPKDAIKGKV